MSKDLFVKGQEHLALKQQNIKAFLAGPLHLPTRGERLCVCERERETE